MTGATAALLNLGASPLEAALAYSAAGLPVLPLNSLQTDRCSCGRIDCPSPGKHPLTLHGLHDASTDQDVIREWWQRWPQANVGLAMGVASGLVVVDVDPRHGGDPELAKLAMSGIPLETLTVRTGGGGRHLYFHCPGGAIRSRKRFRPGVDFQADGSYVVAPPSVHASGQKYEVATGPETPIALPLRLLELFNDSAGSHNGPVARARIPEGERNAALTSIAGRLRRQGLALGDIEKELERENLERCEPPLEPGEVRGIARSVSRYPRGRHGSEGGRTTQAERLVALLEDAELFVSDEGECYATVSCRHERETWALRASGFKSWLMARYFDVGHGAPSIQALQSALGVLEGHARAGGVVHPVWTRLAETHGVIYLDLGSHRGEAVAITPEGWRIIPNPPVKFRRPPGLRPLPAPFRGGELGELRQFISAGDQDWRLIITWLLAALRPAGPYPILLLHGEQGSAKSTTARVLRALVDPSAAPLRAEPRDVRDLMIAASNGWVVAIDNLSRLSPWLSDALCSLATGGGFATRALYSDDAEKIFSAERPVVLNGIDEVATNGDLLDRALLVYLPHIPEALRRTEAQLRRDFAEAQPRILGAALDAVVQGLRDLPAVNRDGLPRMADFAVWGRAVAPTLGWSANDFDLSYSANRDATHDLALEASPIAAVILEMMENERLSWEGIASGLLELLAEKVGEGSRRQRSWPKSPRALAAALRRLSPNLRNAGVEVTFIPRCGNRRPIRIESVRDAASLASPASRPEPA